MIKAEISMTITAPDLPGIAPEVIAARLHEELKKFRDDLRIKYEGTNVNYDFEIRGRI